MALKVFPPNVGRESGRVVDIDARLADSRIGREKFFWIFLHSCEPRTVALPEADAFKTHSRHDEGERLPGELIVACGRIEPRLFERAFLQTLLVEKKAVGVPSQKLHALPVLGEEHEDVTGHRGQGRFALDQVEQCVDALAHVDRPLAHEVPAVGI